jgi:transposase InsO family protein
LADKLVGQGVPERTACQAVGINRSSYRYEARPETPEDPAVRERVKGLALIHQRYGYRRITALLRRDGYRVNPKRVWRLWRGEGLSLPRKRHRKRRIVGWEGRPQSADQANRVWSYDVIHDRTVTGQTLRMLVVLDEHTRECLGIRVQERLNSEDVADTLAGIFKRRGRPEYLRSDNGPEFVSNALRSWLEGKGVRPIYIEPGSPWENGFVESLNGKFRDECLNAELFWNQKEAQVIVEDWRRQYNQFRPHSALGYLTPAEAVRCPETATAAETTTQGTTEKGASTNQLLGPD